MSDHGPRDQASTRRSWHTAQNARNAMLTELLGFVPQLLLDDLADAATDTVNNGIDGLEVYLRNEWLPKRPQQPPPEELEAEIENGLLEFHTLLCGHRDMSIDMLETWSMRNVFHVPPELKVVMPHQRGLDLATAQGKDVQMQVELDVMRRKIENARRFQMQLKQAEEVMQHRLERSVTRLQRIKELQELDPKQVEQLPTKLRTLHSTISSLPNSTPPPPTFSTSTSSKKHTESRAEFLDWAVKRLVTTSPSGPSGELSELAKDIQSDKQADDETRLVGPTNVAVSPKSSNPAPGSGDLSTIYETSFVGRPSDDAGTSVSLDVTGSEGSSLTHTTTKRRRSSVLGGSKRRRSSLGLSERAKAIVSANLDRSAGNAEEE